MYKFYDTLSFDDSIDHKKEIWSADDLYSYRCWYEEDIQRRKNLLIMVGDSWTWGDHLGTIDWNKNVNDPVRPQQIAGRLLSDIMDADWVNLARPGCSNYWMLEKLQDILPSLMRCQGWYKNIYMIVTFTEDLRESTYGRRIHMEERYRQMFIDSESLKSFLSDVESLLFQNFQDFFRQVPFVSARCSRAFTDVWPNNHSDMMLGKTWCDVIQDKINFPWYLRPVPFIGQMAIDPLTKKFMPLLSGTPREEIYKIEFLELMENVGRRWNFLGASEYNLKGSTYHPNASGHRLWAEYIYSQIR